jgi:leader peptidase (prepilin peptidase)/N-methyltransferase
MELPGSFGETLVYFTTPGIWLLGALMFALGAALGSFLNVVAYRLPRGMSLSSPGSRCPACGKPIRWYDNVPIFGWLLLRGRCRDCRAAISPRYPMVELLAAVAAVLVVRSAFVPVVGLSEAVAAVAIDFPLVAFRMLLVYSLLCAALLEFDGSLVPWKLLAVIVVAGLVATLIWPDLRPDTRVGEVAESRWLETGRLLALALMFGLLAWPLLVEGAGGNSLRAAAGRAAELALPGIFLGPAALAAIAVLAVVALLAARVAGRISPAAARFGWACSLVLATLIWIALAAGAAALWPTLADLDRPPPRVAAGAIVAAMSIIGRAVIRDRATFAPARKA